MRLSISTIPAWLAVLCCIGCTAPDIYLEQHRQEGTRAEFDVGVEELKGIVSSLQSVRLPGMATYVPLAVQSWGQNAFHLGMNPAGTACLIDVAPAGSNNLNRSQAKTVCHSSVAGIDKPLESSLLESLSAAVERSQGTRPAVAAAKPLISDVDAPKYKKQEDENLFAVVVGVENYRSLPKAKFAERDAKAFRAHLQALGVPMRNILFAVDQDATRAGILKAVHTWLPGRVNDKATVFFYYSGHGAPDPESREAFLVPIDGDPEALDDTAFALKSLYRNLGELKAKRVIVALDSCFSGAGGRSVLASGTRPLVTQLKMPETAVGHIVTFSASRADQISGTVDEQGHGAFTYYFLKGLNDAADPDGAVTIQALYDYLKPKVADAARLHNHDQTPGLAVGPEVSAQLKLR